ncbi:MAG TPA: amino acid adenylation domain-containing protein [Pyrinomonadaceae bacterium]|nr:amino acid adenylation domain-containing protein [Pyrinomonadaceae bacterium]
MSSTLDRVLDLSLEEKRALLSKLVREEADGAETFPLSFAQQRLWFLAQLEPENPSYNLPQALQLRGVLDVNALKQTLNMIVARHESLRTTFKTIDGQPVQIVSRSPEINLAFTNLEDLPAARRETEAQRIAMAEAWRPFDLSRDYPIRAALVRLDHDHHWLLLTLHHIASDGWSLGIMRKELSTIYDAITTNRPIELPELPVQYADFAEWQREWLQGEVFDEQLSYWRSNLAGAPPELQLPVDRPRPAQQSFQGATLSVNLSEELSRSLVEFSQREGVTLFMTLLAAFKTLLYRYSGQQDIVVGTPIAGRNRVDIEGLIGFFVNTLALRTNFSGNPSFRQLLGQVKEATLGALAHQDLPFEKLVEELNPERNVNHSPIFQVVFGMQNAPRESLTMNLLTITRLPLARDTAKFDLTLNAGQTDNGLICWLEYNTDLFEKDTISRLLGHFERLLEAAVVNPETSILQLPLLSEPERTQLITEWNNTHTDFPDQRIHQIFEEQVENRPNSIALEFEDQKVSYSDLNRRANQLAHYLRALRVRPDETVALCVERSIDMFVGILGILKAGGAYLPLDPSYPRDRLAFMIEDAKARVLLTHEHLQHTLPDHSAQTIFLDSDWKDITRESTDNPTCASTAENLAYVMYTSGSTGKPKGVAIPHRSVIRLVQNTNYATFGPDEVLLQFATLSFDASTFEIWGSLLNGGRLVVMPPGLVSLEKLGEAVKRHNVTTLWLTAGLFHQMMETDLDSLRGVRQLIAGGNVLSVAHVEQVAREFTGCQFINGYGPTENTTFTCCYPVKPHEQFTASVPIGFPISNTQVYILDDELQPVPIGVVGELYTGGAGLARGYLNDPALTAQKFIPHPLSDAPGARLYRTGDLARYRSDGCIEFLGRIDHQVKLRGYRIELGEIETAIKEHPAVQSAVVTVGQSDQGDKHLVAYVVADSSHPELHNKVIAAELKALLKKSLPDYMVPAYFVSVEKIPLMPSGKIDLRALPPTNGARPELEEVHVAPRDDLERRLAHIFEKVLGVQSVGIRDNFFDLGGHSLLAVRVVSEIEKEVGQRLPLVSFFQGANIEYLASLLRQDVLSLSWPTVIEIQKGTQGVPLFCVSMPNVNALGYRTLARCLGPDQPVYGLQSQYPADLDREYSQEAVDNIATEYLESLRAVRPEGPYQFVGICRGAHIAFEMARRLEQDGQQVALVGVLDTWVAENTYNIFFYLDHYAERLAWLTKIGLRNQLSFIRKKAQGALTNFGAKISTGEQPVSAKRKRNPLHEIYFPGPNFVPRTYKGKVSVFRARQQPRQRIRDVSLGWGRLALGGADVYYIGGGHTSVLKEPHVQSLATELKKCLLRNGE